MHANSVWKYRYKPTVLLQGGSSGRSENRLPVSTIYILWCHSSGKKQLTILLRAEKQVNMLLLYTVYISNHKLIGVLWIYRMETS